MWCVCQSKTIDDDDGLIYRNKVYVKDFSTQSFGSTEPGSLHGSVRRYSLSSQDPPPKLLGAETFTMAELYRVTENFSPQNKMRPQERSILKVWSPIEQSRSRGRVSCLGWGLPSLQVYVVQHSLPCLTWLQMISSTFSSLMCLIWWCTQLSSTFPLLFSSAQFS